MQSIYERYRDRGFEILAVNFQESSADASQFSSDFGLTFPIVLDTNGEIADTYRVLGFPESFFLDRDGVIRDLQIGSITEDKLEAKVTALLGGVDGSTGE